MGFGVVPEAQTHDAGRRTWRAFPPRCHSSGAAGLSGIPDTETLWGHAPPIRRPFEKYINLRPIKILKGIRTPLDSDSPIDL